MRDNDKNTNIYDRYKKEASAYPIEYLEDSIEYWKSQIIANATREEFDEAEACCTIADNLWMYTMNRIKGEDIYSINGTAWDLVHIGVQRQNEKI